MDELLPWWVWLVIVLSVIKNILLARWFASPRGEEFAIAVGGAIIPRYRQIRGR